MVEILHIPLKPFTITFQKYLLFQIETSLRTFQVYLIYKVITLFWLSSSIKFKITKNITFKSQIYFLLSENVSVHPSNPKITKKPNGKSKNLTMFSHPFYTNYESSPFEIQTKWNIFDSNSEPIWIRNDIRI